MMPQAMNLAVNRSGSVAQSGTARTVVVVSIAQISSSTCRMLSWVDRMPMRPSSLIMRPKRVKSRPCPSGHKTPHQKCAEAVEVAIVPYATLKR
jgi:hypothetical protein